MYFSVQNHFYPPCVFIGEFLLGSPSQQKNAVQPWKMLTKFHNHLKMELKQVVFLDTFRLMEKKWVILVLDLISIHQPCSRKASRLIYLVSVVNKIKSKGYTETAIRDTVNLRRYPNYHPFTEGHERQLKKKLFWGAEMYSNGAECNVRTLYCNFPQWFCS